MRVHTQDHLTPVKTISEKCMPQTRVLLIPPGPKFPVCFSIVYRCCWSIYPAIVHQKHSSTSLGEEGYSPVMHQTGHILDLVYTQGRMSAKLTLLSWSEYCLAKVKLTSLPKPHQGWKLIENGLSLKSDGSKWFPGRPWEILLATELTLLQRLIDLWNGEMTRTVDMTIPKCLRDPSKPLSVPVKPPGKAG